MSIQDAISQANYREANETATEKCSNCRFRITKNETTNWCDLFDFQFTTGFVCDQWEAKRKRAIVSFHSG